MRSERLRCTRALAVVGLVSVVVLLPLAAPALADGGGQRATTPVVSRIKNLVVLTGRAQVDAEDIVLGDVVIFNGPCHIDGRVNGDVFVANGTTKIAGTVNGNVTVANGDVAIASTAVISGDLSTQSTPEIAKGARIGGQVQRIQVNDLQNGARLFTAITRLALWFAVTVSELVAGLLLLVFAPRLSRSVVGAAKARTGAAIGYGALLFFVLPIVAVGLMITLVGLPLGFVLLLGLWMLYALGYLASCQVLGRAIVKSPKSRMVAFLVGLGILRLIALVPFLGGLAWFAASAFGLGVLLLAARAAGRPQQNRVVYGAPPDAPPPPPAAPAAPASPA
jgi:Polymer-forming cytoskeletal